MYNCLHHRILKVGIFSLMLFVGVQNWTIGFNLLDEISSKFQSFYNGGMTDAYMTRLYSSNFSKDPFGDAMSNIEDKSMQLKIAGAQYVENSLKEQGCYLSQKKIWGILYYFVPEFRVELARSLKQSLGDYDSQKYVFDRKDIEKYCEEYFVCEKSEGYSPLKIWREEGVKGDDLRGISSFTPADVMTNCQEFFQEKYKKGQYNEEIIQNIKTSEVGADKYRNESTDDSPYDIMADLGTLAKLLYWDAQEPITPVFYNIPIFSNSKNALEESKNSEEGLQHGGGVAGGSRSNPSDGGGDGGGDGDQGVMPLEGEVSLLGVNDKKGITGGLITPLSLTSNINMKIEYDELVEGLDSYSVASDDTELYSSLCEDDEGTEPESNAVVGNSGLTVSGVDSNISSELTNQEYQDLIEYMINAVDGYSTLPEDKEREVGEKAGTIEDLSASPSEWELTKEKIKNCYQSCEGLRIDQKASCYVKCTCGEIKSPFFDPNKVPGLGPILILRFCAVPAVNTKFSVGGKRIFSIEEGLSEIYGVVDKLAREGRLGKWTQQNEFLDSSTKQMNVVDTFAFTIDVEMVDISGNPSKKSKQYMDKSMEMQNDNWKTAYFVSNHLNNPSTKNTFSVIGSYSTTGLNARPEPLVDFVKDSGAFRHNLFEEGLGKWMQQQGVLWVQASEYISNFGDYSNSLFYKKCDKK